MSSIDRRTFLHLGGASLLGIAFTPLFGSCTSPVDPPFTLEGFTPFITPTEDFYVQNGGRDTIPSWTMPDLSRDTWQMEIKGFVDNPAIIRWEDMQKGIDLGAKRTIMKTMRCIIDSHARPGALGWTGNAYWGGIPLRYFLNRAQISRDQVNQFVFTGADGFVNNITLDRYGASDLGDMEPLLAYEMNGKPLTREHGAPVRLILLDMYGFKNIKWLKSVNVSPFKGAGQYQREGFLDDGVMRLSSRSENISESVTVPAGKVEITGHAVSGYAPVTRVEMSIDDGPFFGVMIDDIETQLGSIARPADIVQLKDTKTYPYKGVWTKWRYRWDAVAGAHTIAIRAIDAAGNTQPDDDFEIIDGQSAIVRYNITVA